MLENGAYSSLIDHYYATEKPLPIDQKELHRIAGATSAVERKAVMSVIARFFIECDGAYHQKRCDEEIRKYWKRVEVASNNGKKGGRPTKQETDLVSEEKPSRLANENPTLTQLVFEKKANPNPTHNPNESQPKAIHKPLANTNTAVAAPPSAYSDEFERFWKCYPRKVGKGQAWKVWAKAVSHFAASNGVESGQASQRLAEIAAQFARTPKGQSGEYCPHPGTWLSERRFEDDPEQWQRGDASGKTIGIGFGQVHPDDENRW